MEFQVGDRVRGEFGGGMATVVSVSAGWITVRRDDGVTSGYEWRTDGRGVTPVSRAPQVETPEPRAFAVGDRVSWHDGGGTAHRGVVVEVEGEKVWWTCPTLGRAWLWPQELTLITPAAPVTVQDGAAVLPTPQSEPPARRLKCEACDATFWDFAKGYHEVAADTYLCDECFSYDEAPANPQRMPDFGALNELGFPRMPETAAALVCTLC